MGKRKTADASEIIDHLIGQDDEMREMIEQASINSQVARMIYDARTAAKLTQARLGRIVGTSQSVIAKLEDADYEGHSLTMLRRIAEKLGRTVEIRLRPIRRQQKTSAVSV